jgi:hypothetical protein
VRHVNRWLAVGAALTALVVAGIVIATRSGSNRSKRGLPVFVVLAHATIHAESPDAVFAVNRSGYQVEWSGGCGPDAGPAVNVSPRTSATFRFPNGAINCLLDAPVAPHSTLRIDDTISPTTPPGNYWVWFQYSRQYEPDRMYTAYAKLTILGP